MMEEKGKRPNAGTARKLIQQFRDLQVYQNALLAGLRVYDLSKKFPHEEKYSLTDQIRRSSRLVCAKIAEAWQKRPYEAAFVSKLSDAEGESRRNPSPFRVRIHHRYVSRDEFRSVDDAYAKICANLCG
jgi:four helix bundle protein